MQLVIKKDALNKLKTELYVVSLYKGEGLPAELAGLDQYFDVARVLKAGDFSGKTAERFMLYPQDPKADIKRLLLLGLGERDRFALKTVTHAFGNLAIWLKDQHYKNVCFELPEIDEQGPELTQVAVSMTRSLRTGSWEFEHYRSKPHQTAWKTLTLRAGEKPAKEIVAAMKRGDAIGRGANVARDMGTHPGNTATPSYLAQTAQSFARPKSSRVKAKILGESQLKKMGAGGILAVGQGSAEESKMIVLEYRCGKRNARKLAVIGKGVTFDSGGISLKPGLKMEEMKYDMCGAAAVLGIFSVIDEIKPDVDVFGVIPAAENLPDGTSYKPGDVIELLCGKKVEVINTDAEGRLLLCDALTYAERTFKPDAMMDFATLTGAVLLALGHVMSAVVGNDPGMVEAVVEAGSSSGDTCWPLPLSEEYREMIKSRIADIRNSTNDRQAGTITAGAFLNEAVSEDTPWAHVDIAGTAWVPKKAGYIPGATGVGVHLVYDLLENFAANFSE